MKLGELRGAIRKSKGNPFVRVQIGPNIPEISLVLQKSPLYESLEMAFPNGKGQETGLTFNEESGQLSSEVEWGKSAEDDFLADDDDDGLLV